MVQDTPSRKLDKIVIRVPDGLRERIAAAAERRGRSVNAELVDTLEARYPVIKPTDQVLSELKSIISRIESEPDRPLSRRVISDLAMSIRWIESRGLFKDEAEAKIRSNRYADFEKYLTPEGRKLFSDE